MYSSTHFTHNLFYVTYRDNLSFNLYITPKHFAQNLFYFILSENSLNFNIFMALVTAMDYLYVVKTLP